MFRMLKGLVLVGLIATSFELPQVEAAYVSRGGYTIASHRSGQTYRTSSIRYMTGRGPRSQRYLVGAGTYSTSGTAIYDTYTFGRTSFLGNWAGGPRGRVKVNSRRRNEHFVVVFANTRQYAYVDNIDFR